MKAFTLDLWEGFNYPGAGEDGFRPTLDCYILKSDAPRPAVLVLPGSGYVQCSPREAEALAIRFNAEGFHAFVSWYSCTPRHHPVPLLDSARAFTIIRSHANEWKLNPDKVGIMGFSAGGHLALSASVFYDRSFAAAPGIDPAFSRPDALMLCYPVVSSGEFAHRGSFDALLGPNPGPDLLELTSLEKQVHSKMPPVFIWHTWADDAVPVENSIFLASALKKAAIPFELHIFPEGKHGLSLANTETYDGDPEFILPQAAQWFGLCINWIKKQFE
ncbi:alpha/beta hydrolase [Leadbettera azotonutricia]|uniref:Endo-1,4-beta-xylanase B (Xylanase B) (1,4-beta-D-xylanxylanohydrolase B) n=1 Tax=Leadbettera azotonutricia (strain ATCC BAA-888 / DSM 13862 / ZAS-9) TaxID=545695 RepID=F5YDI3_LEAAZ|nr:alpha/beta hydrolase [Leadbettera azotonutricia]AEF80272.1 endo-1,4-beta-xylanase B (Xylanase B) (1,4-beta-D-xylanxylanohydrolase B) [Leadbettera azotonutricia ZAS-9]